MVMVMVMMMMRVMMIAMAMTMKMMLTMNIVMPQPPLMHKASPTLAPWHELLHRRGGSADPPG
eukprot:6748469-Lingulodinium_polyedra.AAC.1